MKKLYILFLILSLTFTSNAQVVISQVYGGGGNSGATYTHDFIELFNRGTVAQDLTGWSVQYAGATSSTWAVTNLTSFSLLPGQYYLVQEASNNVNIGLPLPTIDASGSLNMSGSNGKVILVNNTTPQAGVNPTGTQIIDKVGFGTTPTGFEGSGPTGTALTNTTSAQRLNTGCTDANNNPTDFIAATPIPRNSSTTKAICSNSPFITLYDGPASGSVFIGNPEDVNASIGFITTNFIMSTDAGGGLGTGGDGFIKYQVKDAGNALIDSGNIFTSNDGVEYSISGLSVNNTYTLFAELVNNTGASLVPAATYTLTVTIPAYIDVPNIAALRAGTISPDIYYRVTGEVVNTYSRVFRNQKYFQDTTGGILVDDSAFEISTVYNEGDGIKNIRGNLFDFNGLLELVPSPKDWGSATSIGNSISIPVVTVSELLSNWENYESELVRINGVTFADGNGTNLFASNTNYNISDVSTMFFRTIFSEADYIGKTIPSGSTNIVGFVGESFGTPNITSRKLADTNLFVQQNSISGLNLYPNPVSNGKVYITTKNDLDKDIIIFDVLGKKALQTSISSKELNVSSLSPGVYIIKINEGDATATRKLIVR